MKHFSFPSFIVHVVIGLLDGLITNSYHCFQKRNWCGLSLRLERTKNPCDFPIWINMILSSKKNEYWKTSVLFAHGMPHDNLCRIVVCNFKFNRKLVRIFLISFNLKTDTWVQLSCPYFYKFVQLENMIFECNCIICVSFT